MKTRFCFNIYTRAHKKKMMRKITKKNDGHILKSINPADLKLFYSDEAVSWLRGNRFLGKSNAYWSN